MQTLEFFANKKYFKIFQANLEMFTFSIPTKNSRRLLVSEHSPKNSDW